MKMEDDNLEHALICENLISKDEPHASIISSACMWIPARLYEDRSIVSLPSIAICNNNMPSHLPMADFDAKYARELIL